MAVAVGGTGVGVKVGVQVAGSGWRGGGVAVGNVVTIGMMLLAAVGWEVAAGAAPQAVNQRILLMISRAVLRIGGGPVNRM